MVTFRFIGPLSEGSNDLFVHGAHFINDEPAAVFDDDSIEALRNDPDFEEVPEAA